MLCCYLLLERSIWTAPLVDSLPLPLPYTGENHNLVEP